MNKVYIHCQDMEQIKEYPSLYCNLVTQLSQQSIKRNVLCSFRSTYVGGVAIIHGNLTPDIIEAINQALSDYCSRFRGTFSLTSTDTIMEWTPRSTNPHDGTFYGNVYIILS